jgi:hypothetical protein
MCIHLVNIFCRRLINNAYATFQQTSSLSSLILVSTSVKKTYVHWIFKDFNPNIYCFILLLCQVLYITTPSPLQCPASFKSLWGTVGLSWNNNYSTNTYADIYCGHVVIQ